MRRGLNHLLRLRLRVRERARFADALDQRRRRRVALTATEVAALSGLDDGRVRKEVEYGIFSRPSFDFADLVYFDVLAVRHIGAMLLRGASIKEVREDYPYLKDEDIDFAPLDRSGCTFAMTSFCRFPRVQ
jgi:hypothetical protein